MPSKKRASSPTTNAVSKRPANEARSTNLQDESEDEKGEFEDKWEDEYESEDIISAEEEEEEEGMADGVSQMEIEDQGPIPYLPQLGQGSRELEGDEELVPDLSTYVLLHHASLQWPCLSFDILRDNEGPHRSKPPFNAHAVAGTQAAETEADANELIVMKWENLTKAKKSSQDDQDSDDSESEEEDDEDNVVDGDAVLSFRSIPHKGGVNRVRAQCMSHKDLAAAPPLPPAPYHAATFSENGKVYIYDIGPHLASLISPADHSAVGLAKTPAYTVSSHGRAEGFALAWCPPIGSASNRLLSGDIHAKIHLSTLAPDGLAGSETAFTSHTSSVEDLQWSPTEPTVFSSCSADQSIRIWDIRVKDKKSVLVVDKAHDSDVNVISWNLSTSYLLLSGGDDGALKVWDLRSMKSARSSKPTPVAHFTWHTEPITSVEWHPTEDSCFAASSADNSVTQWDLSVEVDSEETNLASNNGDIRSKDVPAQLLFVHQGQKEIKEIHWHPQVPGMLVSTAVTGLDVFKTVSI